MFYNFHFLFYFSPSYSLSLPLYVIPNGTEIKSFYLLMKKYTEKFKWDLQQ